MAHKLATQFHTETNTTLGHHASVAQSEVGTETVDAHVAQQVAILIEADIILVDLSIDLVLHVGRILRVCHKVFHILRVSFELGNLLAAKGEARSYEESVLRTKGIAAHLEVGRGARKLTLDVHRLHWDGRNIRDADGR